MRQVIVCLVLIFAMHGGESGLQESTIYDDDMNVKLYGSKTNYESSFTLRELNQRQDFSSHFPQHCKPIHMYVVFRHGTRNPTKGDINDIEKLVAELAGKIDVPDYEMLNSWEVPFKRERAGNLTSTGVKELRDIAQRMAIRFKDFFQEVKGADELDFSSSYKGRSVHSSLAFIEGLKASLKLDIDDDDVDIRNDLMRFFDSCSKHLRIKKMKAHSRDLHAFGEGEEVKQVLHRLNSRLDLMNEDVQLQNYHLKSLYQVVALEEANFGTSLWREVFEDEDLEVLDYMLDLKHYWKTGYGHDINCKQSCPLLRDMFQYMDEAAEGYISNKKYKRGVFRFGHAETLMPLICNLGLFKDDEPLRADNFDRQKERVYKTRRICPMAASVGFVLYACASDRNSVPSGGRPVEFKIQLLHKELTAHFPFCDEDLCPYKTVKDHYHDHVSNCNFDQMCENVRPVKDEL